MADLPAQVAKPDAAGLAAVAGVVLLAGLAVARLRGRRSSPLPPTTTEPDPVVTVRSQPFATFAPLRNRLPRARARSSTPASRRASATSRAVLTYNLAPPDIRPGSRAQQNASANREIRGLLAPDRRGRRPAALVVQEAIGYQLEPVPGYRLIRDRSTPGRANVAAYVLDGLGPLHTEWVDARETWKRTDHPGRHPARSYVAFNVGNVRVIGGHQAPITRNHDTLAAQREGVRIVSRLMHAYHGPSVVLWDANRKPGDSGPGPSTLAHEVGGRVAGTGIDNAVIRGALTVRRAWYVTRVRGRRLLSDHRHAFRIILHGDW